MTDPIDALVAEALDPPILDKDVSSWAQVKPIRVVDGSLAQAENVLTMALHDIAALGRGNDKLRDALTSLKTKLEETNAMHAEAFRLAIHHQERAEVAESRLADAWCAGRDAAAQIADALVEGVAIEMPDGELIAHGSLQGSPGQAQRVTAGNIARFIRSLTPPSPALTGEPDAERWEKMKEKLWWIYGYTHEYETKEAAFEALALIPKGDGL